MDELFSVRDQVVLVSGGSRGIGRELADGFARRGSRVVITGREQHTLDETAAQLREHGGTVQARVCDVADVRACQHLVESIVAQFGRIDSLLNVAGVNRRKPAVEFTEDDYDYILDINSRGAFFLAQAVGKQMIAQGGGSQIHIGSLNNDRPLNGVLLYAMSKAALAHMTRGLALEWGPNNVRVNAIAPGFILTDLTRKLWSHEHMQQWGQTVTPLKRLGTPSDLVGAAIFLTSPASAFMTGQIIYVDGGINAGLRWPIDYERQ